MSSPRLTKYEEWCKLKEYYESVLFSSAQDDDEDHYYEIQKEYEEHLKNEPENKYL